jgi:hypothetical protein
MALAKLNYLTGTSRTFRRRDLFGMRHSRERFHERSVTPVLRTRKAQGREARRESVTTWIETPIGYVNTNHVSEAWVELTDEATDEEGRSLEDWAVKVALPVRIETVTVQEGFYSELEAKEFLFRKLFGVEPR